MKFIAHKSQELCEHLESVADVAKKHTGKIGMGKYGELLGLLHDFGKYSSEFQNYIKEALTKEDPYFNPDEDEEFVGSSGMKGKVDHSTSGAQYLSRKIDSTNIHKMLGQILSLCLVSHHSGLINCLTTDNKGTWDSYSKRILKDDDKTHREECAKNADKHILDRINAILTDEYFIKPFEEKCRDILLKAPERKLRSTVVQFQFGLLVRFLFSALIDADRQDSADSDKPRTAKFRQQGNYRSWSELIGRFESTYRTYGSKYSIDKIRQEISNCCLQKAERQPGLFSLTVPTGGGKTLSSLRFALHHAKTHGMDRIVYIIPFTTIIDQNAQVVRTILEPHEFSEDNGKIVLEHHSNLGAEVQSWKEKLLTENWDAPIVFTTMVQFLEALFGSGTRGARRMHQLAKAVLIFDEIQTLPIKCVHLFNNAINFLVNQCRSSVVLCTATQPLLDSVDEMKGTLTILESNRLIADVGKLFSRLKRVHVHDCRKSRGWSYSEITDLAFDQVKTNGSCLVVVNTKKTARILLEEAKKNDFVTFHLSTGMCPVHRRQILGIIRRKLEDKEPILCISTQLIEAGVDISFRSVVRLLAGLDSIAQAAGRCNRHGSREMGNVFIVNSLEESLDFLKDIAVGKEKSNRVLDDYILDPAKYDSDMLSPKLLEWYYKNYFYDRKEDMDYPVKANRDDTLLNLLSANVFTVADFRRSNRSMPCINLCQSFMTAARLFKSIEAPTRSVVVGYDKEGKDLVNQLCSAFLLEKQYDLIKKAQQYSINLFSYEFDKLAALNALHRVQEGTEIFYLDYRHYSRITGLSLEPVREEEQFIDEYIA